MRIVSLLPSATEMVCGLGLRDQLVGVSHECDFPSGVERLPKVTRTSLPGEATSGQIDALVRQRLNTEKALYSLDLPALKNLAPDLILTQTLCDVCAVAGSEVEAAVRSLSRSPRVLNLQPNCLADVMNCIGQVASATDCKQQGDSYIASLQQRIDRVGKRTQSQLSLNERPSVMLLEWIDPPFSAGHWNPELVAIAGGVEAMGIAGQRSVATSWSEIAAVNPEVLIVACCGFDIARTMQDVEILQNTPGWKTFRCVQSKRVSMVDGSAYFSRPGPRLVDSLEILASTLHPHVHVLPPGLPPAISISNSQISDYPVMNPKPFGTEDQDS